MGKLKIDWKITEADGGLSVAGSKTVDSSLDLGQIKLGDLNIHVFHGIEQLLSIYTECEDPPDSPLASARFTRLSIIRLNGKPISEQQLLMLDTPTSELNLSIRAAEGALRPAYDYIGSLIQRSPREMLKRKNFGVKSLREVKEALKKCGFALDSTLENWSPPR